MNSDIDLGSLLSIDPKEIDKEVIKEEARRYMLPFMLYTWGGDDNDQMKVGFHTKKICEAIDQAFEDFANGKSTYLMVTLPHRHGKSELLSRKSTAKFLGMFPDKNVMATGYSSELMEGFSRDCRNVIRSDEYHELYPGTKISRESSGVQKWEIEGRKGKTTWVGLDGTLTGKGFSLGIVDDPFKDREEVESKKMREKRWISFTQSFLTRAAPVHIVILLATTWHEDDLFGRIRREMKRNPKFPRFKELSFPAKAKDYKGEGEYTGEYLFEEMYPKEWYVGQYSFLGPYGASGLLDCNPKARDGMLIKCVEGVNFHYVDEKPEGFGGYGRGWDLASTEDETLGSDPDWTVGVKGSVKTDYRELLNEYGVKVSAPIYSIYIDDIIDMREEAPTRDSKMQTAAVDDRGAIQGIEAFSGYKDTFTRMNSILEGVCQVEKINLTGDKVAKATQHIVTPFSTGRVYVNRNIDSEILERFFDTLQAFPGGSHDDHVDATVIMTAMMKEYGYSTFDTLV